MVKMNIKKTKNLIKQALENLPLDLRFNEIKNHLNLSLKEISTIEQKEENKYKIRDQWASYANASGLTVSQKENILGTIEQMIQKEKSNLKEIGKNSDQENILLN